MSFTNNGTYICDNPDCELYQLQQDGDHETNDDCVRCVECGQPL